LSGYGIKSMHGGKLASQRPVTSVAEVQKSESHQHWTTHTVQCEVELQPERLELLALPVKRQQKIIPTLKIRSVNTQHYDTSNRASGWLSSTGHGFSIFHAALPSAQSIAAGACTPA
jgi:hypothetical protein